MRLSGSPEPTTENAAVGQNPDQFGGAKLTVEVAMVRD
jgi:hypothetical protein